MTAATTLERIGELGVVPVVTVHDVAHAAPVATALAAGGLPCAEVTLRTSAGLDAVASIATSHVDVLVGAGTVLSADQAEEAHAAGASFVVTPGYADDVVAWGADHDVLVLPGVMTPTEMMRAIAAGVTVAKLFPAQVAGGTALLDAVRSVFPSLRFVPTGGVAADNLADYLTRPNVLACGGSWMVDAADVAAGDVARIEQRARAAAEAVRSVRR